VPELKALELATPLLAETAVRDDAAQAIIAMAPFLSDPAKARTALEKILALVPEGALRQAADLARQQSRTGFGFITAWRVLGPYRQEGRDYADLFDFVFRPESGETQSLKWIPVPAGTGAKRTWLVDLRKTIGPPDCVVYAQTWLHCAGPQPVQLEIGSDSGVKIWLNQKLIHANGTVRVLHPGADKLAATLNPGWNSLLVKMAQPGQGGFFCARLLKPDGTPLDDLRIAAAGPGKN
jgi:hypothetical protein